MKMENSLNYPKIELQKEELREKIEARLEEARKLLLKRKCTEADELLYSSLQESSVNDFREQKSNILMLLGYSAKLRNEPHLALDKYAEALRVLGDKSETSLKASILNNMGIIHKNMGKFEQALDEYFEALKIRESFGEKASQANLLNNIAVVFDLSKNYPAALEYFTKSLELRRELERPKDIAASLNNLGNHFYNLKEYDKALDYYLESEKIKLETGDTVGLSYSYNNIGVIYRIQNNPLKALEYHKAAYQLRLDMNNKQGIINSLINMANDYAYLDELDEAYKIITQLLESLEEDNFNQKLDCYKLKSLIHEKRGEFSESLEAYKIYSVLEKELETSRMSSKLTELETRFKLEQKEKEAEIYRLKYVELVEADREINRTNMELKEHRERLQLINQILRHDILNNLSVTKSAVKIYQAEGDENILAEGLHKIDKSVSLINRMRELEQFIAEKKGLMIVDLPNILAEVSQDFPDLEINVSGKAKIFADHSLDSIFTNLISNAVRHGGCDHIEIILHTRQRWCEVSITDNGSGIDSSVNDKIFEKGFKHGKTANTGMGLYIVKQTMLGYGGDIFLEQSIPGKTRFVLSFRMIN